MTTPDDDLLARTGNAPLHIPRFVGEVMCAATLGGYQCGYPEHHQGPHHADATTIEWPNTEYCGAAIPEQFTWNGRPTGLTCAEAPGHRGPHHTTVAWYNPTGHPCEWATKVTVDGATRFLACELDDGHGGAHVSGSLSGPLRAWWPYDPDGMTATDGTGRTLPVTRRSRPARPHGEPS